MPGEKICLLLLTHAAIPREKYLGLMCIFVFSSWGNQIVFLCLRLLYSIFHGLGCTSYLVCFGFNVSLSFICSLQQKTYSDFEAFLSSLSECEMLSEWSFTSHIQMALGCKYFIRKFYSEKTKRICHVYSSDSLCRYYLLRSDDTAASVQIAWTQQSDFSFIEIRGLIYVSLLGTCSFFVVCSLPIISFYTALNRDIPYVISERSQL